MAIITLEPGEEFPHSHPGASFSTLVDGEVELQCLGETVSMVRGVDVEIPDNTVHVIRNVGAMSAQVSCSHPPPDPGPDPITEEPVK